MVEEKVNDSIFSHALEALHRNFDGYLMWKTIEAKDLCYGYSSENLIEVFNHLLGNKKGEFKRGATVGSSGDQAFYLAINKIKDITIIDANAMSEPAIELKKAAVLNLTREEFLTYWTEENLLDYKVYQKISHSLGDSARVFWDTLILNAEDPKEVIDSMFHDSYFTETSRASEFYLNDESYKKLQDSLTDIKFKYIFCDVCDFPNVLEGKYDVLLLSNVYDYRRIPKMLGVYKSLIENNLAKNGRMQLYYKFPPYDTGDVLIDKLKDYIDVSKITKTNILSTAKVVEGLTKDQTFCTNANYVYEK